MTERLKPVWFPMHMVPSPSIGPIYVWRVDQWCVLTTADLFFLYSNREYTHWAPALVEGPLYTHVYHTSKTMEPPP